MVARFYSEFQIFYIEKMKESERKYNWIFFSNLVFGFYFCLKGVLLVCLIFSDGLREMLTRILIFTVSEFFTS